MVMRRWCSMTVRAANEKNIKYLGFRKSFHNPHWQETTDAIVWHKPFAWSGDILYDDNT